jgi:hypothetical protein
MNSGNHDGQTSLLAALFAAGLHPRKQITNGNRVHRERTAEGSAERIAAAEAKRARKRARAVRAT